MLSGSCRKGFSKEMSCLGLSSVEKMSMYQHWTQGTFFLTSVLSQFAVFGFQTFNRKNVILGLDRCTSTGATKIRRRNGFSDTRALAQPGGGNWSEAFAVDGLSRLQSAACLPGGPALCRPKFQRVQRPPTWKVCWKSDRERGECPTHFRFLSPHCFHSKMAQRRVEEPPSSALLILFR